MFDNEIYLSNTDKLKDYLGLELNMNSSERVWRRAIQIFENRMQSRYFNAIDKLSQDGNQESIFTYGFSMIAIQCLLIDTLVKFRYGPNTRKGTNQYLTEKRVLDNRIYTKLVYYKENQNRFIKFLEEFFIFGEDAKDFSMKFYKDIRCGILHFGSTENASRLTCDCPNLIEPLENGGISVDVLVLNNRLKAYFNTYIEELRDERQLLIRKHFLTGMNYLCDIYMKQEEVGF